jgi:hypothetical protein
MENVHNTEQHGKTSKKDVAGGISGEVLSYWKKIHKVGEGRRNNLTEIMQRRELDKQLGNSYFFEKIYLSLFPVLI